MIETTLLLLKIFSTIFSIHVMILALIIMKMIAKRWSFLPYLLVAVDDSPAPTGTVGPCFNQGVRALYPQFSMCSHVGWAHVQPASCTLWTRAHSYVSVLCLARCVLESPCIFHPSWNWSLAWGSFGGEWNFKTKIWALDGSFLHGYNCF